MTRLAFTVVLLLFLFSSSTTTTTYADLPSDSTLIQDPFRSTLPDPESESITTSTILLPSEKPESEPATTFDLEPDTVFSELAEQESSDQQSVETESETETETDTVPLTVITFRPMNRQFARRPNPMLGRRHHPCHHHHRQMKPWGPGGVRRSYGDDMILTGYKGRSDPKYPIPAGWMKFEHHPDGHRFPYLREGRMMRPPHHEDEDAFNEQDHHHDHERDDHDHYEPMSPYVREGRMMRPPHHEDDDAFNEQHHHHDHEHDHDHRFPYVREGRMMRPPHHEDEDAFNEHDHHHDHEHDHHHDHEHDHHDHEHDHHHDHEHEHEHDHHDHEQGSLISKVRKFLHHF